MTPSVLRYDVRDDGFGLYLGEVTTSFGLSLVDQDAAIVVERFGATGYRRLGWATETDLPPLPTVGDVRRLLDDDVGLIDFAASTADVSVSSHDDGEVHFVFRRREALVAVLTSVVPPAFVGRIVSAVLGHPGRYVSWDENGDVTVHVTFEAWLASQG